MSGPSHYFIFHPQKSESINEPANAWYYQFIWNVEAARYRVVLCIAINQLRRQLLQARAQGKDQVAAQRALQQISPELAHQLRVLSP